ncbi:hypothetical protein T439DRAFT_337849 [Meredithblackwellia eburnea MCA 4105]
MSTQQLTKIIFCFHRILVDSLAEARGENLVTDDELESGDVDIQIAGPSLALFFAAIGSKGAPPSISAPDGSFNLTSTNCPPSFKSFFTLWQKGVPQVQRLSSEARHDLALLLCGKDAESSPLRPDVARLAADLKAVAIEIIQRRTFQQQFGTDLEQALNSSVKPRRSGESSRSSVAGSAIGYVPPPEYEDTEVGPNGEKLEFKYRGKEKPEEDLTPELLDNLAVIRETLYSALADCIVEAPSIVSLARRGPEWASRVFFTSTALSILEIALTRMDHTGVRVVNMGRSTPVVIGPQQTPTYLRPFLTKLMEVSDAAKAMAEEDDERAIREASEGNVTSEPKLDRLRERLELGAGAGTEEDRAAASQDASVGNLANAINELAIGMASLPSFRERQAEVFKVLQAVSSY